MLQGCGHIERTCAPGRAPCCKGTHGCAKAEPSAIKRTRLRPRSCASTWTGLSWMRFQIRAARAIAARFNIGGWDQMCHWFSGWDFTANSEGTCARQAGQHLHQKRGRHVVVEHGCGVRRRDT